MSKPQSGEYGSDNNEQEINVLTKEREPHVANVATEITIITPQIAEAWLNQNTNNRNVSTHTLRKYTRDMTAGHWQFTGDPIRFDKSGRLIDGQHRLMACVKSGIPFRAIVVYGLDALSQDVIDTGKSRTAHDVLSLRGLTNTHRVAASLRVLITYRDGIDRGTMSTSDIISALERHPNITKSAAQLHGLPKSMPMAALTFVHYVATYFLEAADTATEFIGVFKGGIPTMEQDAAHMWRERCLHAVGDQYKIRSDVAQWTTFYAWNAFAKRRPIGVFRVAKNFVPIDGLNRELL